MSSEEAAVKTDEAEAEAAEAEGETEEAEAPAEETVEETETAETPAAEVEAPQVEALAAAAAAAASTVTAQLDADAEDEDAEEAKEEASTPSGTENNNRESVLNDEDAQGKRKFFPRVKQLIQNKEWEDFLTTVLQVVDRAGAPECAAASHRDDNSWVRAFNKIYDGVASDYSVPNGKNRYHKFKDKIVEVWQALEALDPGEHVCRDRAINQLNRHRLALTEHATTRQLERQQQQLLHTAGNHGDLDLFPPAKRQKKGPGRPPGSTAANINAAALARLASSGSGKRGFGATKGMGGGLLQPSFTAGAGSLVWQNLDETACLNSLPEPLRSLVHFKQLSREMAARTFNRGTKKSIDMHGKTVDTAYLTALQNYIKTTDDESKRDKKKEKSPEKPADGDAEDAAMDDNDDDNADGDADVSEEEEEAKYQEKAKKLFNSAGTMAFLYRYASSLEEQRVLNDEYRKYTAKYIIHITSKNLASQKKAEEERKKKAAEEAEAAGEDDDDAVAEKEEAEAGENSIAATDEPAAAADNDDSAAADPDETTDGDNNMKIDGEEDEGAAAVVAATDDPNFTSYTV